MRVAFHAVVSVCLVSAALLAQVEEQDSASNGAAGRAASVARPPSRSLWVASLGNIRRVSSRQTEPTSQPGAIETKVFASVVEPHAIAIDGESILLCDSGHNSLFRQNIQGGPVLRLKTTPRMRRPVGILATKQGELLVCDIDANAVIRFDASGKEVARIARRGQPFRPAACLLVGDELWVANTAAHQIDVFDVTTNAFTRSFGSPGAGPGQFAMPLGMDQAPNGDVYIVDSLNCRVQVFDSKGEWLRSFGRAGDRPGCFGRPKNVAVGPDGTVFVVDSASQRVHVFDAEDRGLLVFGEPGGGPGAFAMPGGITIVEGHRINFERLPAGFKPAYYVLVGEQLNLPGVRAFAWGEPVKFPPRISRPPTSTSLPALDPNGAENPHWSPDKCSTCHKERGDDAAHEPPPRINESCLSCHDGHKATAEPHPIARAAVGPTTILPKGWPAPEGRIGCLTCHDIRRHCSKSASRPVGNTAMLRSHDPARPLSFCAKCHTTDIAWRTNPHDQLDAAGRIKRETCGYCHTDVPDIPASGRRHFDSRLRLDSSRVCLSCHVPHWDYVAGGHPEKAVTKPILHRMLTYDFLRQTDLGLDKIEMLLRTQKRLPRIIPLEEGRMTCYTCHNPHEEGLFPAGSELGARASSARDNRISLRRDKMELCLYCHAK